MERLHEHAAARATLTTELMSEYKETKTFLSMCVCIQLLKILKFTSVLVPKWASRPTSSASARWI